MIGLFHPAMWASLLDTNKQGFRYIIGKCALNWELNDVLRMNVSIFRSNNYIILHLCLWNIK